MAAEVYGGRAKCLQRLIRLDLPVPVTVALSFDAVRGIAAGRMPDLRALMAPFGFAPLLSVRPSSLDPDWGGPGAILNIGMTDERHEALSRTAGPVAATSLYLRFIQSYAIHVARLDPDAFTLPEEPTPEALRAMLAAYEAETDEPFPQSPATQLAEALRSMARAWEGTTARLLRQAKGAPADAGLGLVVQAMALGIGRGESGSGVIQFVDGSTGEPRIAGRYLGQSQGREALAAPRGAAYLVRDPRGPSLEEAAPDAFAELLEAGRRIRTRLKEEMQIEFTLENGRLRILDAVRVPRSPRAALRIAVALAEDGIIPREEAILRVDAEGLARLLHPQVDPAAPRDVLVSGIGASPGAASGRIVLSPEEAEAAAARGEPCILVRRETAPEDIRGMHAAVAVVTIRGGLTSHAAVIGRGLGLPCVVGAAGLEIDRRRRCVTAPDGRVLREGDLVTVDGTAGEVLLGEAPLLPAQQDAAFRTLLDWADLVRGLGVRANADTPADARLAREFGAEGIGLCRTEHMFFEGGRIGLMREMIFAEDAPARRAVLDRLLPLQRADFLAIFRIMAGHPVCIRLFDPPLHEFLPADRAGLRDLAEALSLPLSEVEGRIAQLSEYNPMLGLRGVRLGVTVPEIYEMQARAIFEAAAESGAEGAPVVPEVMIPLVSARREVELVAARIDAVAASVRAARGVDFAYRLGVMVETPRAALRAAEIAQHAAFLSFGSNDLTQLAYGLSRDDASRFLPAYVAQGVFEEDPFQSLDLDGVGELIRIGAERGRHGRGDVVLALCGEHGGTRRAIEFCRREGFDYVSCSPFRVPIARLSAAQATLRNPDSPRA
ncbi:pyruvate, phosphate dikinase [Rubellimicrobium sp. CFH 75288]|nr:putative PEP-binding protein [Rubellimicrobium sp. CFH 75288]NAZ35784.1 pyruvate, phosphate dikinase [Rubellimicrobium sp. CFH 75288]